MRVPINPASHTQRATTLDSHRSRRTKDRSRKAWYAYYRQVRFARWLGFVKVEDDLIRAYRNVSNPGLSHLSACFV